MSPQFRIGLRTLAIGATMAVALIAVDVLERGFDANSALLRVGVVALLAVLWGAAGGYAEGFAAGRKAEHDRTRRRAEDAQAREQLERLGDLKNPTPVALTRELDPPYLERVGDLKNPTPEALARELNPPRSG